MPNLKPGQPPTCKRCGRDHWGYVACDKVPEFQEIQRKKADRVAPTFVRVPRQDGLSDWRDRLETVKRIGENVLVNERKPMQTGRVTGPPGWTPPGAA